MSRPSNTNSILKNTIFLYGRMMVNMLVSLYTSRLTLEILGIDDFGIYNIVGGIVILFAFFNNAMSASTQRFLNIEKASEDKLKVNKIFNVSVFNHLLIALLILILAETAGRWLIEQKLNIPAARMDAANWVYQISVSTILIQIVRTPYNALLLAYERMSFYAYSGIFETAIKLASVYALLFVPDMDHLIGYAVFILLTNILVNMLFFFYSRRTLALETKICWYNDPRLAKEHLRFSGWSLMGQFAVTGSTQGFNMLLNIFFGVTLNAALGIANQVNTAVFAFVSNVQIAFNPQIVQSYAVHDRTAHINLVLLSSRCSLFLLSLLCIPFLFFIDPIMHIWLGDHIPPYAIEFTEIVLCGSLITALAGPFWMSAYAVGNIGKYQLWISLFNLTTLPLAYLLLKRGHDPMIVLISRFVIELLMLIYRYYYFAFSIRLSWQEMSDYISRCVPILILVILLVSVHHVFPLLKTIATYSLMAASEILAVILILFWGIKRSERISIKKFIKSRYYAHTRSY